MEILAEGTSWVPSNLPGAKPVCLEIADAIAQGIKAGVLRPTDRLPPQRTLASLLNLNFATVARAYSEPRQRGLIDSRVGDGTFIRPFQTSMGSAQIDMTMNLPPQPENLPLMERMREGISAL